MLTLRCFGNVLIESLESGGDVVVHVICGIPCHLRLDTTTNKLGGQQ
jgi:hypothetical protein